MKTKRLPRSLHFSGSVIPPGSKSIANRALPLAALANGTTELDNLPDGDDVALMRKALATLGYSAVGTGLRAKLTGTGSFRAPNGEVELFLGNSGTATRILTALLAAGEGTFRVTGIPRMYERPIGDLVDALRPLCGETKIIYEGKEGVPPLRIEAKGLAGGKTKIRGNLSSQFVTGLLMAMPLCKGPVEVEIEGELVSAPYVNLTLKVMKDFGKTVAHDANYRRFWISNPKGYASQLIHFVEPDASSASYFLAGGAITNMSVSINGIDTDSAQGESGFATVLERMGAHVQRGAKTILIQGSEPLRGIDIDMDKMSDTGMTLAVTALFAEGKTTIRNVGNWRLKETDRLKAMATELKKLCPDDGREYIQEGDDWISIDPPAQLNENVTIETYDDHRMAMCFSLVSLGPKGVPVNIKDPDCVNKTYPGYWKEFAKMTGKESVDTEDPAG